MLTSNIRVKETGGWGQIKQSNLNTQLAREGRPTESQKPVVLASDDSWCKAINGGSILPRSTKQSGKRRDNNLHPLFHMHASFTWPRCSAYKLVHTIRKYACNVSRLFIPAHVQHSRLDVLSRTRAGIQSRNTKHLCATH